MNPHRPLPSPEHNASRLFKRNRTAIKALLESDAFKDRFGSVNEMVRWLTENVEGSNETKNSFSLGSTKVYHNIFNLAYPSSRFQYRFFYYIGYATNMEISGLYLDTKEITYLDLSAKMNDQQPAAEKTAQAVPINVPNVSEVGRIGINRTQVHVPERIRASRTLSVGVVENYPIISIGENGELLGVYGRLVEMVAKSYALKIKAVRIRTRKALDYVSNGKFDVILGLFQTSARAREVDFCALLYAGVVTAVTLRGDLKLRSLTELASKQYKLAVGCDEAGAVMVESGLGLAPDRFIGTDSLHVEDVMRALERGAADVAISDGVACMNYIAKNANANPPPRMLFKQCPLLIAHYAVMTQKEQSELCEWLEDAFRHARQTKEYQEFESEIINQYQGLILRC